jgi:hypothetical protein
MLVRCTCLREHLQQPSICDSSFTIEILTYALIDFRLVSQLCQSEKFERSPSRTSNRAENSRGSVYWELELRRRSTECSSFRIERHSLAKWLGIRIVKRYLIYMFARFATRYLVIVVSFRRCKKLGSSNRWIMSTFFSWKVGLRTSWLSTSWWNSAQTSRWPSWLRDASKSRRRKRAIISVR